MSLEERPMSQDVARVNLPEQHVVSLSVALGIPEDARAKIAGIIATLPPGSSEQEIISALLDTWPGTDESLRAFLDSLIAFEGWQAPLSLPLNDLLDSLLLTPVFARSSVKYDVRAFLSEVVKAPAVVSVAKAYDLGTAYNNSMDSCRIISDIRLIFDDEDATKRPQAAVVVHSLEIRAYDDVGDTRTFYFSLDYADLLALEHWVRRAKQKSSTIEDLMTEANIALHKLEGN
jgi:hypothetical protein